MNLNNQSQFELFPGNSNYFDEFQGIDKKRSSVSRCILTLDKVVLISVAIIMVMVLSFSLGVEKGKRITIASVVAQDQAVASKAVNQKPAVESSTQGVIRSEGLAIDQMPTFEENIEPAILAQKAEDALAGVYTVQVASFKKVNQAQKEADTLKQKGFESIILPKGKYTIVCVGKFGQRNDAKLFISKLKKRYKDCLVRRL